MPLNIDIVQILLHMLNFVILAGGLTLLLFKPVKKFIGERQQYFEKQKQENEKNAAENEKLKEEYEAKLRDADAEIAEMKEKVKIETAETSKEYIDTAQEKANAIIAEAENEAEIRQVHILDSAQTEIGELVIEATQKLLTESASEERVHNLYDEFIKKTAAESH